MSATSDAPVEGVEVRVGDAERGEEPGMELHGRLDGTLRDDDREQLRHTDEERRQNDLQTTREKAQSAALNLRLTSASMQPTHV